MSFLKKIVSLLLIISLLPLPLFAQDMPAPDVEISDVAAMASDIQWYISNAAGMTIEKSFPLRAIRSKNALAVRRVPASQLPGELRKYYSEPWKITLSILYEEGKRVKTQWVFRDELGLTLFVASIGDSGAGFIEWYNDQGLIVEEQRLDSDGSGFFISYTYKGNVLLKAEAHLVAAVPEKIPAGKSESEDGKTTDNEEASNSETEIKTNIEGKTSNIDGKSPNNNIGGKSSNINGKSSSNNIEGKSSNNNNNIEGKSSAIIAEKSSTIAGKTSANKNKKENFIKDAINDPASGEKIKDAAESALDDDLIPDLENDSKILEELKKGTNEFLGETDSSKNTLKTPSEVMRDTGEAKKEPPEPEVKKPVIKASVAAKNPATEAPIPDFFVTRSGREGPVAWTDSYRYTRSQSLRLIERRFSDLETAQGQNIKLTSTRQLANFPRTMPIKIDHEGDDIQANAAPIDAEFLNDVMFNQPAKITYKTDSKRRILSEIHTDENGEIVGEMVYEWVGDRLGAIEWKSKNDLRRIEYAYTSRGDRISEKDYRNGELERTLIVKGNQEHETLYKNSKEIMRAVWEDGRKISELRVR
ncbi:hypothetical protein FACS1894102_5060 [Spirochaetia bacterium]|nr:hypothetical protein FACS1894102_5060 [Spirochaetia bacterium]